MDLQNIIEKIKVYIALMREKIQSVSSTQRDKRAILLLGAVAFLLALYFTYHFFSSGTVRLEKRSQSLETELGKVQALSSEYKESNKRLAELAGKIKREDEPLISLVEKILLAKSIERQNFSIRDVNTSRAPDAEDFYEEKSVDVELKKITLDDLVDILYKIQNNQSFLKVSNLNITTKYKNADSINVKLRVSTFEFEQVT